MVQRLPPSSTRVRLKTGKFGSTRPAAHTDSQGSAPEAPSRHQDGWHSAITGLGTNRDKRQSHHFRGGRSMSYQELARLWEGDDIVCKAVEAPTSEAFRPGFEINISDEGKYDDLKEDVEDALEELEVEDKLDLAHCYRRAFGGSATLLGMDDGRPLYEPLDPSSRAPLDYLDVYEPIEIIPASLYGDPLKPKYGQVEYFQLNAFGLYGPSYSGPKATERQAPKVAKKSQKAVGTIYIHESRLIVMQGIRVSRYLRSTNEVSPYWGAPIIPRFIDTVRDFEVAFESMGIVASDISQSVISIKNLLARVKNDKAGFHDRMAAIELGRSVARAIVIDQDNEKYDRQTTQLAGVADILDRLSQRTAASIGIPLSVLIGYSPASLGKPDSSEMTLWYNIVRALQRRRLTPPLKRMAKIVMRSMRERKLPKRWGVEWGELEHMTTPQLVEARRVQAQTDNLVAKAGMATSDELRKARYKGGYSFNTTVDENKKAPGFIAPMPAGVLPKGMTPEAVATALEAGETVGATPAAGTSGGAAGAAKPVMGAHSVAPYTRRDPKAKALVASPGSGATAAGDGGGAKKDAIATCDQLASDVGAYTAANEAHGARAKIAHASPAAAALLAQLAAIADTEAVACAAGTCGPDCVYDHSGQMDDDRPVSFRTFGGMKIGIESPKGSVRKWTDSTGASGETVMTHDYGYIDGVLGDDGDSLDCTIGDDENSPWIFIVNQMDRKTDFATHDEQKAFLGFGSADQVRQTYVQQHGGEERYFGGMQQVRLSDFQ